MKGVSIHLTNDNDIPPPTYYAQVVSYPLPTLAEQQQIIASARAGDRQAREAIITSCLGYVLAVARTLSLAYQMEYEELVGMGNLALVEKFAIALTKNNAYAYLRGVVKWELIHKCYEWRHYQPLVEEATAPMQEPVPEPERDYVPLYSAISTLSGLERQAVMVQYGLLGTPKESLYKLSLLVSSNPKGTLMHLRLRRAQAKLRKLLVPAGLFHSGTTCAS